MLTKVLRHARDGSLLRVARTKVSHLTFGNRGAGDTYYGDKAASYDRDREGQAYWDDQQRIAEALLRELPDGVGVLDVPFGTGRFLEVFGEKSFAVSGVELSPDMIQAARTRHPDLIRGADIRIGDACELPFEDGAFDVVLSFRFLSEIVESAVAIVALRELRRVSADLALLDLGYREDTAPTVRPPRPKDRLGVALTEAGVRSLLADVGFTVDRVVPCYRSGEGWRGIFVCRAA